WSAAVVYAAIMHDAAKVLVDIDVYTKSGKTWRLWHGNIPEPYQIRYRPGRDYHLHEAINPIICDRVLGPAPLDWLYSSPEVFTLMMYTISGHPERAGIIGEIVNQADQSSVAKALGGNPSQAFKAPVESLQRKLADGLRFLVKERLSLNVQGAPAFLTDEALWLVAPRVPRDLKSHLLESGVT
ncbi:TraI domain-containing protein, partial [Halomonas sp. THAF12]|uniref:TraI domain-containing protein n=1 Tax=Halomonas sp. B23F22_10 TaxID=3459515 RepID=UPI00373F7EFA